MRRRIRKKRHLKEFSCLGFGFDLNLKESTEGALDKFIDDFDDFVTPLGLCFGGGGNTETNQHGFFVSRAKGSCTQKDVDRTERWLRNYSGIKFFSLESLTDCYWSGLQPTKLGGPAYVHRTIRNL